MTEESVMGKSNRGRVLLCGLVVGFTWALLRTAGAGQAPASAVPTVQSSTQGNLRVLFIGNSYTHLNDLPGLTARLAASARPSRALETFEVGEGGATLKRHWEAGRALEAIRKGNWDYVVIQEQGGLEIRDTKMFNDYARLFDAEIKKAGARTVFFLTWARQDSPQDQALLTNAHASIAGELKALVAPVGRAWQNALEENPKMVLHWSDRSHPNAAGTYLAACVFYAVVYSSSPEGLSQSNLSETDAAFLQRIAWRTARGYQRAMADGKIPTTEIPIPVAKPAAEAARPARPEALERGRAILAATQQAAGGLERLRDLKDVSVTTSGKIFGPEGEIPIASCETIVFPGVLRSEQQFALGNVVFFFDGHTGWRKTPQGVRDLTDIMRQFWRAEAIRNTFNLLRAEGEFSVQFEKREKVGEIEADVILISKESERVRMSVEPGSGMLLKKSYRGMGPGGPADFEQIYSDYREVSGIVVPFRIIVNQNGAPFLEATVNEVKFNSGVDPAELAKRPQ